ncbi:MULTISPECIES: hypothetical protein [unclassified Leucobacter]|uniref:hypothetical protein n=1 Tax=unclassified Leucobacter TaxID=2621730 RepID=UPI00062272ED|nr:hypothetical protein [Leucobacter sp. Ag1]KKI16371.1 hypothetical protein XM48_16375 [Leucobacter sp. Ag1]
MVFEVPASKASIKQNQFQFKLPDSKKTYTLPKMQYISSDIRERMQRTSVTLKAAIDAGVEPDPADALEASKIQRELFERYAPGLYELVTDDQIRAIQEAWQEASSIELGESSPSAD